MFARTLINFILTAILITPAMSICAEEGPGMARGYQGYAGSKSCMECHEKFYNLWSTSKHGLAMQPYTADFARDQLTPPESNMVIGRLKYRADLSKGLVVESGPKGKKQYKIEQALGGKNVYYFLTPFPRGRLQTLPIAYDVRSKQWFDTAASGVRHFPRTGRDQPVSWRDPQYTFNTSLKQNAHGLHVWIQPFEELRAPLLFNLRSDPFERAEYEGMGYNQWFAERMFAIAPAAGYVAQWLQSFREFPPRQKPGSFNLDRVMESVTSGAAQKGSN